MPKNTLKKAQFWVHKKAQLLFLATFPGKPGWLDLIGDKSPNLVKLILTNHEQKLILQKIEKKLYEMINCSLKLLLLLINVCTERQVTFWNFIIDFL